MIDEVKDHQENQASDPVDAEAIKDPLHILRKTATSSAPLSGTKKRHREQEPSAFVSQDHHIPLTSHSSSSNCDQSSSLPSKSCKTATLFVAGIHQRVADVHLHKLFQPYGTISRIFQCCHKEGPLLGQPKGYAFVEYQQIESATLAMNEIDGKMLLGRSLVVRPAHEKSQQSQSSSNDQSGGKLDLLANGAKPNISVVRREKSVIELKIEAVKRAIAKKQKKEY